MRKYYLQYINYSTISKPKLFQDGGRYHIETNPLICGAKSMDWLLYDNGLRLERVKSNFLTIITGNNQRLIQNPNI